MSILKRLLAIIFYAGFAYIGYAIMIMFFWPHSGSPSLVEMIFWGPQTPVIDPTGRDLSNWLMAGRIAMLLHVTAILTLIVWGFLGVLRNLIGYRKSGFEALIDVLFYGLSLIHI